MTIAILLGFVPGPRLQKRIDLEKTIGDLHLICWDRGIKNKTMPEEDGFSIHSLLIPTVNNPLKRTLPYLKFRSYALKELDEVQPDVIHLQGLDMLKIACEYKRKAKKPVHIIYEVGDLHRLIVDEGKTIPMKIIRRYLINKERKCCKDIDLLIVTSMKYVESHFGAFVSEKKTMYIPNVPNLTAFKSYKRKESGPFTVGFIGGLRYKKQIQNMIDACTKTGLHMMFAGYEEEPQIIYETCKDRTDVDWYGRFNFDEKVAEMYGKCNVMYSVYDADMENVRVALPNKLYEAVYCEMPLIVAKGTYLEEVVNEWGVGVAVDHRSAEELIHILNRLKTDKEYYKGFADNCKVHKDHIDLAYYNAILTKRIYGWMKNE